MFNSKKFLMIIIAIIMIISSLLALSACDEISYVAPESKLVLEIIEVNKYRQSLMSRYDEIIIIFSLTNNNPFNIEIDKIYLYFDSESLPCDSEFEGEHTIEANCVSYYTVTFTNVAMYKKYKLNVYYIGKDVTVIKTVETENSLGIMEETQKEVIRDWHYQESEELPDEEEEPLANKMI